jgi:hypothetical protein
LSKSIWSKPDEETGGPISSRCPPRRIWWGGRLSRRLRLRGRQVLCVLTYGKCLLDASLAAAGAKLEPWTLHDLRRIVATGMAELGVAPHVIEAILNPVSGHKAGVAGIYNRATYEKEKRAALVMWANHVTAAVESWTATVVPVRA